MSIAVEYVTEKNIKMFFLVFVLTQHFLYPFQIKSPLAFLWTESLHLLTKLFLMAIIKGKISVER